MGSEQVFTGTVPDTRQQPPNAKTANAKTASAIPGTQIFFAFFCHR